MEAATGARIRAVTDRVESRTSRRLRDAFWNVASWRARGPERVRVGSALLVLRPPSARKSPRNGAAAKTTGKRPPARERVEFPRNGGRAQVTDKWAPLGATVMVESADPARLDAAEDLVRKSLELAKSPQRIPVARQALGRVIGRNGERIKSVNERSGAKCSVNQEGDPCYVVVESEDPMRIQVAREMIASFMESSTAKLWVVEEAARGKAESALHGAFAGLPSPLAPAQQAFATAPVNGEPAPTQAIDPYKHADLAWASARDPAGRTYYYNAMTGQSTWEKPPGFSE